MSQRNSPNINNNGNKSPLINRISTQQSPLSPFKIINSNEKSPFTVEQTNNCRLKEPLSPFMEKNTDRFVRRPTDPKSNNLKILTQNQKSPNDHMFPISPFNMNSPSRSNSCGPKTSSSLKSNQVFSAQADMPIIPQSDSYDQSNRSSIIASSAVASISPAFIDTKKELDMQDINSIVSNIRKGQELNVIDKILFDTPYSGMVDHKFENEMVRHNSKNNTLFKCFSRSSSGIFSFKSSNTQPNMNSVYFIEAGDEIGTTRFRRKKEKKKDTTKKTTESPFPGSNSNSVVNTPINEDDNMTPLSVKSNIMSPKENDNTTPTNNEAMPLPQNTGNKLVSTFSYDQEYLLWRDALIDILKNSATEEETYGNRIHAFNRNINNNDKIDYMLRMPLELLTLLNSKIK